MQKQLIEIIKTSPDTVKQNIIDMIRRNYSLIQIFEECKSDSKFFNKFCKNKEFWYYAIKNDKDIQMIIDHFKYLENESRRSLDIDWTGYTYVDLLETPYDNNVNYLNEFLNLIYFIKYNKQVEQIFNKLKQKKNLYPYLEYYFQLIYHKINGRNNLENSYIYENFVKNSFSLYNDNINYQNAIELFLYEYNTNLNKYIRLAKLELETNKLKAELIFDR